MPQAASWAGSPSVKGSSESMRMALLTFSLIGLQFTWGIEMTYCTPYLLQLGLTKSKTSLVWIAGPLSGLIMQPVVGVIADRSKSKWGRRRPFMIGGSILVGLCLIVLGWTKEIVGLFVSDDDDTVGDANWKCDAVQQLLIVEQKQSCTIALAVLSIYAVDFAINAVQSCCRSLIVDTLPIPKQQLGSAWASRMIAIGHLFGYIAGTVNLLAIFGTTFGDTQFKQLCLTAATVLIVAVSITSYAVKERILIAGRDSDANTGAITLFTQIIKTTWHLPARIQAICWVQFWSWIGWFPFLFYSTTWVGETYFRYSASAAGYKHSKDTLGDIGRVGSLSLVVFSSISLLGSIILPFVVLTPEEEASSPKAHQPRLAPRPPSNLPRFILPVLHKLSNLTKPDLLTAWTTSHLIFSASMCLAPFVRSLQFATVLVSICGIPWALTCWAPFAFMGVEINRLSQPSSAHHSTNGHAYHRLSDALPPSPTFPASFELTSNSSSSLHLHHHSDSSHHITTNSPISSVTAPTSSTGELAGIYLGILNLFTTLPQFVGTFISMIVFYILEPSPSPNLATDSPSYADHRGEGRGGWNAIAVCLFIGALSTLVAAEATRRLRHVH